MAERLSKTNFVINILDYKYLPYFLNFSLTKSMYVYLLRVLKTEDE